MFKIPTFLKKLFGSEHPISDSALGVKTESLSTVGLYYPKTNTLMIRNPKSDGISIVYNIDFPGDMLRPVSGKWLTSQPASIALFDVERSVFLFRQKFTDGKPEGLIPFGDPSRYSVPLAGDWDGDGISGIGIFNSEKRTFHLKNTAVAGLADYIFAFGRANQGLIPIAGDWNGDGKDTVGLYDPVTAEFMLKNSLSGGAADIKFQVKNKPSMSLPLAGDWLGNGRDSVGIYDLTNGSFRLIDDLNYPDNTKEFSFGPSGQICIPFSLKWHSEH